MKLKFFTIAIFSIFHYVKSQTTIVEYDYFFKSPVMDSPFHYTSKVFFDQKNKNYIYEVYPLTNVEEGVKEFSPGKYVKIRKDDFKYMLYSNSKDYKILDKLQENVYLLEETMPTMVWKYSNETKNLDGQILKKATTNFRGRNYVAWYSENAKLSIAPWKFNNLKGTDIEVYSDDNIARWKLKSKTDSKKSVTDPFVGYTEKIYPYTDYTKLAYELSPALKEALSKNPNNKIFEQPRTNLETKFEWEK